MNTCECEECRKYIEYREKEERKLWEAPSPVPSELSARLEHKEVGMENDKFEKCKKCRHRDEEKSSENWCVCKACSLEMAIEGTSKNCSKFEDHHE